MSGAGLDFTLSRDGRGRLVLTRGGERHDGVQPVRAFPLAAPDAGLALVGADGRELAWIERLDALPPALRALLDDELAQRELMPCIRQIVSVSTFATPSVWEVETDRGRTRLTLRGEEDIRRLGGASLLVTDAHGLPFRIPDYRALDRRSRRLLERFL